MATFSKLAGIALALFMAPSAHAEPGYEDREVRRLSWPELQRFENDREFRRYLRDVRSIQNRKRRAEISPPSTLVNSEIVVAMTQDVPPEECIDPDLCPVEETGSVVVTGSRMVSQPATTAVSAESITNTQKVGVDEGDIVKRIGDYFLVLQDGRLFAVNFRTMTLTDRIDVYRKDEDDDPIGADWYDEMLVHNDQIIVTAYSYEDDASELSVFRLDQASGQMEPRGVFLISSDDYYDIDNYATRIAGDNLIIHTPYQATDLASRENRPHIRRWIPGEDFDEVVSRGKRVLDAEDIVKPVFGVAAPYVHTISVCPLGDVGAGKLDCDSTAFVGSELAEMFVSTNAVYLWTSAAEYEDFYSNDYCKTGVARAESKLVPPGAVYRLAHRSQDPEVLSVRGVPHDQFSMDETDGRFRMLLAWARTDCDDDEIPTELALLEEGTRAFGAKWFAPQDSRFEPIPTAEGHSIQNRFVGPWLVYGGRANWGGRPPYYRRGEDETEAVLLKSDLIVVNVSEPSKNFSLDMGHQLTRLEALGLNVIATGYRDNSGLIVSHLDLSGVPQFSDHLALPDRFESESRSHAFNATLSTDGSGMLGLPTVLRRDRANRFPWYSDQSDISFMSVAPNGALGSLGALAGEPADNIEPAGDYACEVSCIDWYGNARPFFVEDRIFGLMGTDLVEAQLQEGAIVEKTRVDLTASPR